MKFVHLIIPGISTLTYMYFELVETRQPIKDHTLSRESPTSKPPLYWLKSYNQACLLAPTICSLHTSRGCQTSALSQNSALVPRSSLSPCPPVAPVSGLMVEILNCNFKAPSQNLIYAKLR